MSNVHFINILHIQVPNFGFIVFTDSESVERALAAKPILLYGSHRLNVEEKKMRAGGERGPHPATFGDRDKRVMSDSQVKLVYRLLCYGDQLRKYLIPKPLNHY